MELVPVCGCLDHNGALINVAQLAGVWPLASALKLVVGKASVTGPAPVLAMYALFRIRSLMHCQPSTA